MRFLKIELKKLSLCLKRLTQFLRKLTKKSLFSCSIQNNSLPLHRKPKVCGHIIKAFISACFGNLKSCKISFHPKQEGSKRPLGYDYPATERPCVDCSVWWHFIFGVGVRCLFLWMGLAGTSNWRISKGKVPRFFYIYTNGSFGANFPQKKCCYGKTSCPQRNM